MPSLLRRTCGVALAGGEARGRRAGARGDAACSRAAAGRALIAAAGGRTLTEREAKEVLARYGVPVVGERVAQSVDEAVNAADTAWLSGGAEGRITRPSAQDRGRRVRLNLRDEAEVRARLMPQVMAQCARGHPPPRIAGVLVQPMMPQGVEIVVGARVDPLFGPLIVVGLGGILVELLQDTALGSRR